MSFRTLPGARKTEVDKVGIIIRGYEDMTIEDTADLTEVKV